MFTSFTDQCNAFAEQALSDALKLKTSSSGAQWAKKDKHH
jgi:hypothetical protein